MNGNGAHAFASARFRNVQGALGGFARRRRVCLELAKFGHLICEEMSSGDRHIPSAVYGSLAFTLPRVFRSRSTANSEVLMRRRKFSPDGLYGKWFSLVMISVCALWLLGGWLMDRLKPSAPGTVSLGET